MSHAESDSTQAAVPCPVCGSGMVSVHCKALCRGCGYTIDCSDW